MELDKVVRGRRMCRDFRDEPVDPAVVDRLVDLAARAPSAGGTRGWDWLVLEGKEATARFWALDADPAWLAAPDHPGLLAAPVIVVPLADAGAYRHRYAEPDKRATVPEGWDVPYWLADTAFATMLLLLGAEAEGLGALFFALHGEPAATLATFGVPAGHQALGAVALGWPAPGLTRPVRPARRRPSEQVHRDHW